MHNLIHFEILKNEFKHKYHHMGTFLSRLILVSSFYQTFSGSIFWCDFLISAMFISVKLKTRELFLALISFLLGWSLYLSIILKIGFGSNESGHLCPWFRIFKYIKTWKYSLNVQEVFTERFSNWAIAKNNFFAFNQVNFRMFSNLFRQKWLDNFPKYSVIVHDLGI